jgi:hypothetical protein
MTYVATYETKVGKGWLDINDQHLCSNLDRSHTICFRPGIYLISVLGWVVLLFECRLIDGNIVYSHVVYTMRSTSLCSCTIRCI